MSTTLRQPTPDELEPIERASRDELAALQLERLRAVLHHAYTNVPLYRKRFDAAGVHPDDLRHLGDISMFPFTAKDDLRQHYPFGMLAVPRERLARIHASSGTTGRPTVVGYTAKDIDVWAQLIARSMRAAGVRRGDLVHVATEKQVRFITDLRPTAIMVTPSYVLAIADEFVRQGLDPRGSSLTVGIHGAEPWTESMRREIEERFDMHAVDIYGLSEVMGPGVASECVETKDGLHVWEDHFYPEIVDPATGEVIEDGTTGELVFTTPKRSNARSAKRSGWSICGTSRVVCARDV